MVVISIVYEDKAVVADRYRFGGFGNFVFFVYEIELTVFAVHNFVLWVCVKIHCKVGVECFRIPILERKIIVTRIFESWVYLLIILIDIIHIFNITSKNNVVNLVKFCFYFFRCDIKIHN